MKWTIYISFILFLASCAGNKTLTEQPVTEVTEIVEEPYVDPPTAEEIAAQHEAESIQNQLQVEIKYEADINIVVRDLVTVNSIETGLTVVKLMYKSPLIFLVNFNVNSIEYQDMKQALLAHPNVLNVSPYFGEPPVPVLPGND